MTPTSASALISCPAREPSWAPPTELPSSSGSDIGSLAHLAIAQWLESDDWQSIRSPDSLAERFNALAGESRAVSARGRLVASRLRTRAGELCAFLNAWGAETIRTEVMLTDYERRLWGRIDILISSESRVGLIEIKTGEHESAASALSEYETRQIQFYAHLILCSSRSLPATATLFSLKRGLINVPVTQASVIDVVTEAVAARQRWFDGVRSAVPAPDVCKFCPQRMGCSPSWHAMGQWPERDGAEGVIQRLNRSSSGKVSLVVAEHAGVVVISGLSPQTVGDARQGDRIRVLGVQQSYGPRSPTVFVARKDVRARVIQRADGGEK
ncbi:PD-(D/E)XK nuclease family protein [Rhodococcus aetherivorans]|uniref:PD-(D/E)XK nuclease family protein n=1 Tax=Rhodococcus aetherivorans TaxID=191292 RepID=UPI003BF9B151